MGQTTPRSSPFIRARTLRTSALPIDDTRGLIETRFLDPHGNPIPDGEAVPHSAFADILVYDDEGLRELLRKRVFQGAEFDLTEGLHVVARAVVVSVGEI